MAAETKSVYLSSTLLDMAATRAKIDRFFTKFGWTVKQSYDTDPWLPVLESCLEDVRTSDVYVAVVGFRYGTEKTHSASGLKKSITEHEFDAAVERKMPCHVFLLSESATCVASHKDDDQTQVKAFRARIGLERRPAEFRDLPTLMVELVSVIRPETAPAPLAAADHQPFRLPPLPGPMQDRQQAIRVTTLSVFGSLGSSVPNAANSLQSQWQTDAAHDDQTAIWALTTLTRALENQPLVGLVPALNSRDHGHFSDGIKLLMRLFVCRAFSEDGWQRLGNLTGQDKLEIADLWLLHSGAQAASGRDFDLPELAASGITPGDAAPSNRFLHHLMPGLCAGFGAEMKRQITGEMLRQFIDFTVPPQPAEADEEAQIKWERRLAAFVRNRGRTERRRYAVGLAVADEAGASQLASVAIPLGVLPLAYVESARDDCLVAPDEALDLLDALQQCQTALHRLTPSPTHQP